MQGTCVSGLNMQGSLLQRQGQLRRRAAAVDVAGSSQTPGMTPMARSGTGTATAVTKASRALAYARAGRTATRIVRPRRPSASARGNRRRPERCASYLSCPSVVMRQPRGTKMPIIKAAESAKSIICRKECCCSQFRSSLHNLSCFQVYRCMTRQGIGDD